MRIEARAATRIDLAGGTLDLWPLYLFVGGAITINLAINLYATASIEPVDNGRIEIVSLDQNTIVRAESLATLETRDLPLLSRLVRYFAPAAGLRLATEARVPAGSGLGGSSTLAIAVCGALNELTQRNLNLDELIGISRDIEAQVLEIPTGEQDYYAAAYGGLNAWHFDVNSVRQETYDIPLSELQQRLLLFYSGLPRSSGINNWHVFQKYVDGESSIRASLASIAEQSRRLHHALKRRDWQEVHESISAEWKARRELAPAITTQEIDRILAFGREQGATGKVCGAGGGGCVLLIMDPDRKATIEQKAREHGFTLLDFEPSAGGLTVSSV